jgi:hypothetical protein
MIFVSAKIRIAESLIQSKNNELTLLEEKLKEAEAFKT